MASPVPPSLDPPPDLPVITVMAEIKWADGAALRGIISARSPDETVGVVWQGDLNQVPAPPERADASVLTAWMADQAERTGGVFSQEQNGHWSPMDQVKR
jgi:hypothetical protein